MSPDPAVGSDSDECVGASSPSRASEREKKINLKLDVLPYEIILCLCYSLVKGILFCKMCREV